MEKPGRAPLTEQEKQEIRALYADRLLKTGISHQTVGWSSVEQQRLRFKVLSEIADLGRLNGSSICDVGCGLGDLLPYLQERGIQVRYTGYDICPELISSAKERFKDGHFEARDILDSRPGEKFDWVFLSGALNYRVADNWSWTQAMLKQMFEMANQGVACNFLTSHVDFENPINYHHEPKQVLDFALSLTRRVALRHDYPLWEFTAYLYKIDKNDR